MLNCVLFLALQYWSKGHSLNNKESALVRDACKVTFRRRFFKTITLFSLYCDILFFKHDFILYFNILVIPSHKNAFEQV